jgi:hypothetical protein
MRKWLVPLSGNSQVLFNLNNWVNSSDFNIYEDSEDHLGEAYFLESVHLDGEDNYELVVSKLKGLLELINGAIAVHWEFNNAYSNHQLSFDNIYYSDAKFPGERDYSIELNHFSYFDIPPRSPFSVKIEHKDQINSLQDVISARVRMAEKNEAITILLRQISAGFDWRNLYSIWDTVAYFCKGEKNAVLALNIDSNLKSAFTGTANSFAVLGPAARHGEKGWDTPTKLMTLIEANDFIYTSVVAYLKKFHCINCYKKLIDNDSPQ